MSMPLPSLLEDAYASIVWAPWQRLGAANP